MSHENQWYFIFASWKNGRNAKQIHEELVNVEGEQAFSISSVKRWIATFKDGEEQILDKPRSGHPCEAVTPKKIAKVEDLVSDNPHISTRELAHEVDISRERLACILHDHLRFRKVCAKWVPHKLTEDNKQKCIEVSKQLLETLDKGYRNIITGDETWIYFFTTSTKEANKSWIKKGANRPQIVRTAQNSKK